jgi:L-asparaginase
VIHLLFTGGTISMQHDAAAGGNVPTHAGEALLALAPGAAAIAPCRVENWARIPACHLTQADHWRLRERVGELMRDPAVQGIVVTHGTDTLEETAYLLDRTLAGETPVVCTGAMRTSDHAEWDGSRNLTDAIRVAAAEPSRGRGTQVVFAGRIWQGREAVKVNTVALDAFGAPFGGQRGSVTRTVSYAGTGSPAATVDAVSYAGIGSPAATVAPAALSARVTLVPMVIGDRGEMLDAMRGSHDGVVIEAFGSGNLPPGAVPAIGRWIDEGKPVVLSTRCANGEVSPLYAFEGGGARTVAMGVIPAGPRTASQARWELTIALSAGVPYASGLPA